jgi:predicted LPLAT superfamily acyltransferase
VSDPGDSSTWSGRTLGGNWLFASCAWLLPKVGAIGAWLIAWPIAAGFLSVGGRRQFGMRSYWRRRRPGAGPLVHGLLLLRHYHSFGLILCDRLLVYLRPGDYVFAHDNRGVLERAVASPTGCILLAAHVGNWEVSGMRLAQLTTKPVNLVMVRNDIAQVQRYVDERMRGERIAVIDPRDPLGASMGIHSALSRGEVVCMLGDRTFPGQPSLEVPFLGGRARFPVGPFHVAALAGAPIVVCFLMKTGLRGYRLEVDEPWRLPLAPRGLARSAMLQAAVGRWAARLERQVRRYPLQWHNFFEFWS